MKFTLRTEYRSQTLWYFVFFAFGAAFYFGLPCEPPYWMFFIPVTFLLFLFIKKHLCMWGLLFFLSFGLLIAATHTHFIQTKFLQFPARQKQITGQVANAYFTSKGQIAVLNELQIEDSPITLSNIRISLKGATPPLQAGDSLRFIATLYPPQPNQALRFFYQGIEAQGQLIKILEHTPATPSLIAKIRSQIRARLWTHLTDKQAQIAIPLVTGEQQLVDKETYVTYRKAGIAHVLSVSGFHMALLAAFVFFFIRGFLALLPQTKTQLPAKKIAAVAAFLVTGFYLLISGHQVPALRAFFMISLVFLGILTDRKTFSIYTLLLVGFCLLLFHPEWITSVSFQLSFIAVMILIGLFEDARHSLPQMHFIRLFLATLIANVLITLALAPFVIYHFNQFNPYGVIGNLLTSLLFSLFVMPFLFIGTTLIPFGGEAPFFKAAGFVLDLITRVVEHIASWPYSEILLPSFSAWGLSLISFGLCFLCLVKNKYRFWGFAFIGCGFLVGYFLQPQPDLVVLNKGKVILSRNKDNSFSVKGKSTYWAVQNWLHQNGQTTATELKTNRLLINGHTIALAPEECAGADLAILARTAPDCTAKDIFIPKRHISYSIFVKDTIKIQSEARSFSRRPWRLKKHFNKPTERIKNDIQ